MSTFTSSVSVSNRQDEKMKDVKQIFAVVEIKSLKQNVQLSLNNDDELISINKSQFLLKSVKTFLIFTVLVNTLNKQIQIMQDVVQTSAAV